MAALLQETFSSVSTAWTIAVSIAMLCIISLTASIACACCKKKEKTVTPEPIQELPLPVEPEPAPKSESEDAPEPIVKCIYNFALDFYRSSCATPRNVRSGMAADSSYGTRVVSPLAMQSALYLCYLGAGGSTKQEIRRAIYPQITVADQKSVDKIIRESAAQLAGSSADNSEVAPFNGFSFALRVYAPSNTYRYSAEFHDTVSQHGCRLCDFFEYRFDAGGDRFPLPLATFARSINRFVQAASEGEMQESVDEALLKAALAPPVSASQSRQARPGGLIVFAQMRIKCNWMVSFPPKDNWPMDFTVPGGYKMPVETMSARSSAFGYYQDSHCQMVRLPLADADSKANLYVLLPANRGDLVGLEAHLTGDRLWRLMRRCNDLDVKVTLPKMFIDSKLTPLRTAEALQALGLRGAFDPYHADFTPMLEGKARLPLHIAVVIHNVVFEAYEEAGSSSCDKPERSRKPKQTFKADHPFIFVVASGRQTQIPLMMGRFGGQPYYKALQERKARPGR